MTSQNKTTTFREQFLLCKNENMIGIQEGSEIVMMPAFPNQKIVDFVLTRGEFPRGKLDSCKRFGGDCCGSNQECQKLRSKN